MKTLSVKLPEPLAQWLVGEARQTRRSRSEIVREGRLRPNFKLADEAAALETLMKRYADKPMSLTDACLVRLAEIHKDCRVFTLDRHFKTYRRYGRSVIPLLSPW